MSDLKQEAREAFAARIKISKEADVEDNMSDLSDYYIDKASQTKCKCVGVAMGSYRRQVTMIMKRGKWEKRAGIDVCLAQEIAELWAQGIETVESCCGHNITSSYIAVIRRDVKRMKALGYKPCACGHRDIFHTKSIK